MKFVGRSYSRKHCKEDDWPSGFEIKLKIDWNYDLMPKVRIFKLLNTAKVASFCIVWIQTPALCKCNCLFVCLLPWQWMHLDSII